MNTLELKARFFCENDELRRRLSKTACLDGISCVFISKTQTNAPVKDNWSSIVFSDDFKRLAEYRKSGCDESWLVYTGSDDGLSGFDIGVLGERADIWCDIESDERLFFRFRLLLARIREWYDARWYKNLLTTTIDSIPDLVWYKDAKGAHELVNDAFCQTVHKSKEQVAGRGHYYIWDITPEEYQSGEFVCMESEDIVMEAGKTCMFEEPVKTSAGMKHFNTYKTPVYDLDGRIWGTVGVAHDATSLSNMGLELSMLVENIPFPMVVCSEDWRAVRINSYFRELFGISEEEISGFNYQRFKEERCVSRGRVKINDYNHAVTQEYYVEQNGERKIYSIVEQELLDFFGQVTGHFCLLRDVTAKRYYEKQIFDMAHTDPLTGLNNRRAFYEYVKEKSGEKLHLLYMDLDRFKQVNDRFGHDRGDEVLCKTAKRITEIFPNGTAARLGGDEFALLLTGEVDKAKLEADIEKLEKAVRGLFREDGFYITISVGVVSCDSGTDIDAVIKAADEKMYAAKKKHHIEFGEE